MRGNGNERANEETMELTGEYVKKRILADGRKGYGVAAMDLAGAEALYPTYNNKSCLRRLLTGTFHLPSMQVRPWRSSRGSLCH